MGWCLFLQLVARGVGCLVFESGRFVCEMFSRCCGGRRGYIIRKVPKRDEVWDVKVSPRFDTKIKASKSTMSSSSSSNI